MGRGWGTVWSRQIGAQIGKLRIQDGKCLLSGPALMINLEREFTYFVALFHAPKKIGNGK
jgi:hypothetical protein